MNSIAKRCLTFVALTFVLLGLTNRCHAHDIAKEFQNAAKVFLKSLDNEQAKAVQFQFDDPLRKDWHFIPKQRQGLGLHQMKSHQRGLAMAFVQTALSHQGYSTSMQIMAMEQVLRDLENNNLKRDPTKYHIYLFGTPSAETSWGWRIEGHHLSISVTIIDGKQVIVAPSFLGANPATVKSGPLAGTRVLGDIEDAGRDLVKQLSVEQKATAVFSDKAPRDVINGPARQHAQALTPTGLTAADMNQDQQQLLRKLLNQYLDRFRAEIADADRKKIEDAGFEKISFGWAGQIQPDKPHYFRAQGPTFILEYDNTQNGANHVHVLWRDFKNDFGEDSLRKHYETQPHGAQTSGSSANERPAIAEEFGRKAVEKSANP